MMTCKGNCGDFSIVIGQKEHKALVPIYDSGFVKPGGAGNGVQDEITR
jgi:hypothetical protein